MTEACWGEPVARSNESKRSIDYTLSKRAFNAQPAVKRLLHFIREEKPFFESRIVPRQLQSVICVKGKHTNCLIAFQSGAFLLLGHDTSLDEQGTDEINVERIAISNKPEVLRQLDQLNINESTVFPCIESSAEHSLRSSSSGRCELTEP